MPAQRRGAPILLAALFFASGATALAAQVVLNRLLGYVFGASHLATATVLAAYMAGLSAGAFFFGRISARWRRPVVAYGVLELSVALLFLLVPLVFPGFQALATALAQPVSEHAGLLTLIRFLLSFTFVLGPTVLMGATLPTLLAGLAAEEALTRRLPLLYAVNTLGGATGAVVGGYFAMPMLGLDRTLWLCAAVNTAVGLVAIAWGRGLAAAEPVAEAPLPADDAAGRPGLDGRTIARLAFGQGALAFTLEVVWSHLGRTALGNTTYAFTVMLTAILVGIGLGSLLVPVLIRRGGRPIELFAGAQAFLAAALAGSLYLWDRFPLVIVASLRMRPEWSFVERELGRFGYGLLLMLPATLALGVALPSLTAAVRAERLERRGAAGWVGLVLAANTLGGILGSVVCGFVLLGRVGSSTILSGAALLSLALALGARFARVRGGPAWHGRWALLAGAACLLGLALFPGWNQARLTAGNHLLWDYYAGDERNADLLLVREDSQAGFITVEAQPGGPKVMRANGKYEGSDAAVEFQDYFALLGGLYLKRFDRCLLVGLGPGRTLRVLHDMPFAKIEVAEMSSGIADVARLHFGRFVDGPLADTERVRLYVDDGRNRLQLAPPGYDFVSVGVTGAAFAGAGGLYDADFFRLVRARLARDGVFLLWMQVHHIQPPDTRSVFHTLRTVFPNVHFYATPRGDQGFLLASLSPLVIDPGIVARLGEAPYVRSVMDQSKMRSLLELVVRNVFSTPEEIDAYLQSPKLGPPPELFTDFWPGFEYRAARGLATRLLFFDWQAWSAAKLPAMAPALPPGEEAGLRGLRLREAGRRDEALAQLEASERLLERPAWTEEIAALRRELEAAQRAAGQSRPSSSR